MLPVLNALQDAFGFINPAFIPKIATALNISSAEVHGVISFYHDYRDRPPGRMVVKLCRAEACQAMGCRRLEEHAQKNLPRDATLEAVYCLGNCAAAPSVMIDGQVHGRVTPEKLDRLTGKKGKAA